jgi:HK97 family phage major capsid protein
MDPLQRVEELRQQRGAVYDQMQELDAKAKREGRSLYPDEQKKWERLEASFDQLAAEVEQLERAHDLRPTMTRMAAVGGGVTARRGEAPRAQQDARDGLLGREQRMADWQAGGPSRSPFTADDADEFSLGRLVRGMATGRWDDADLERRALAEGTDSAGGFLTPEVLASNVIDRVRDAARVMEAGATTVPLDSDKTRSPGWRPASPGRGATRTARSRRATRRSSASSSRPARWRSSPGSRRPHTQC